ncbi:hypothetical protein FRB94_004194 [Tulasnella sp. JGI-2019a]|nr:hypothetical protein FRB94_004194 [Tulasnella sp. JGI-2019a]
MIIRTSLYTPSRLLSLQFKRALTTSSVPIADRMANVINSLLPAVPSAIRPPPSSAPTLLPKAPGAPNPFFIPPAADPLLTLLACVVMKHGEKHKASRLITDTLAYLHSITLSPPLPILREAIDLVSPSVKVVTLRKPSKNVLSPRPLTERQRAKQAFRWILTASEKRPERSVTHRLGKEIINVIRGESEALKKKEEVHRQAVVNR